MANQETNRTPARGPDELIGVTEGGKSALGLATVLVSLAVVIAAFVITTC